MCLAHLLADEPETHLPKENMDAIMSSPQAKETCMYENSLADLSEAAMRRLQIIETKEAEIAIRRLSGDSEFDGVQVPAGMEK